MVYLLHFTRPLHHAQHYLGYAGDLDARIDQHRSGNGARLVQVCAEHGIDFLLVRTWEGGRDLERHLKNQHNGRKLCPLCNGCLHPASDAQAKHHYSERNTSNGEE